MNRGEEIRSEAGRLPGTHPARFPAVTLKRRRDNWEAVCGLGLSSVLSADVLGVPARFPFIRADDPENPFAPENRHSRTGRFLDALAGWPKSLCLELHFLSLPDLTCRPRGTLWVSLILISRKNRRQAAEEEIARAFLAITSLLTAHFDELDFRPIQDRRTLAFRLDPFAVEHVAALVHRSETLSLSHPIRRLSMGFGPLVQNSHDSLWVDHVYPWMPAAGQGTVMLRMLMELWDPFQIIVRLRPTEAEPSDVADAERKLAVCESFLASHPASVPGSERHAVFLRDLYQNRLAEMADPGFRSGVFLLSSRPVDNSVARVVAGALFGTDPAKPLMGGWASRDDQPAFVRDIDHFVDSHWSSASESACAFKLPAPPSGEDLGLPVRHFRTGPARLPETALEETRENSGHGLLFVNEFRGGRQPVEMTISDRLRHLFLIGQTGTGKSTLMEHMILQDIRSGLGVAVIDPHGDLVEDILGKIPPERIADVMVFDLLDRERPMGFNLLQWRTLEERDLIVDELYAAIDQLYDLKQTGGPIFESNFRGMLKLLMGDHHRPDWTPTLLDFTTCYLRSDYRKWLLKGIEDQNVLDFVKELERTGGEASLQNLAPYVTSKINRFIQDTTLQRILGQDKTAFDFDEMLAEGKIFLVKLGRGRFGTTVSALIANQLISRFKLAAMGRSSLPREKRRPFFLYVDECHSLPTDNFTDLLSEARKFGLGLILATQYATQLTGSGPGFRQNLMSAVVGNVGTFVVFRLGLEDAEKIGKVIEPDFSARDIIGLPNWRGYARAQIRGESVLPFSFQTVKDITVADEVIKTKVTALSRNRYGCDAAEVDNQIQRRRSSWRVASDSPD